MGRGGGGGGGVNMPRALLGRRRRRGSRSFWPGQTMFQVQPPSLPRIARRFLNGSISHMFRDL